MPQLEDTVFDAHTRDQITVITQKIPERLRFCRWSMLVRHQKSALFGSEIRMERSHSILCTNRHKVDIVCFVFSSHSFWTSGSLDVPAGVTQEEGHKGFFIHLPSAVRALICLARRIQPFLSKDSAIPFQGFSHSFPSSTGKSNFVY